MFVYIWRMHPIFFFENIFDILPNIFFVEAKKKKKIDFRYNYNITCGFSLFVNNICFSLR